MTAAQEPEKNETSPEGDREASGLGDNAHQGETSTKPWELGAPREPDDDPEAATLYEPPPPAKPTSDRVTKRLERAPLAEDAPHDDLVGRVIDERYKILAPLGAGGMATVYKAWHLLLEKEVAIKFIRGDASRDAAFQRRFFQEARVASSLVHPNAVATREFGETADGIFYLVMDFCPGRSLRQLCRDEGLLPPQRAARITAQILDALAEAHKQSIVHRDIKPANIVVDDADHVRVLDFGLAKILRDTDSDRYSPGASDDDLTATGMVMGTPKYMSPEQGRGQACDHLSDIYSVGLVLYELLCGLTPFEAPDACGMVMCHIMEPPPPMSERAPEVEVPEALERAALKALAKKPGDRWSSAGEFSAALATWLRGDELTVELASDLESRSPAHSPRFAVLLTLALAAVAGALLLPSLLKSDTRPAPVPTPAPGLVPAPGPSPGDRVKLKELRAKYAALRETIRVTQLGSDRSLLKRYGSSYVSRAERLEAEALAASLDDAPGLEVAISKLELASSLWGDAVQSASEELARRLASADRNLTSARGLVVDAGAETLAPAELASIDSAVPSRPHDLAGLRKTRGLQDRYAQLGQLVAGRSALRDLDRARRRLAREVLELSKRAKERAAQRPTLWEKGQDWVRRAQSTSAPIVSQVAARDLPRRERELRDSLAAWGSARRVLTELVEAPTPTPTRDQGDEERLAALQRKVASARARLKSVVARERSLRGFWSSEPGLETEYNAILRLHQRLGATSPRSDAAWQAVDADWRAVGPRQERFTKAFEVARSQHAALARVEVARGSARRLLKALSSKSRIKNGAADDQFAHIKSATAALEKGDSAMRSGELAKALAAFQLAGKELKEAQAHAEHYGAVRVLLKRLRTAIQRRDLRGVKRLFISPFPSQAKSSFKRLFDNASAVSIEFGPPTVKADKATAHTRRFEYRDKKKDTPVPRPRYTARLKNDRGVWKVVQFAPN